MISATLIETEFIKVVVRTDEFLNTRPVTQVDFELVEKLEHVYFNKILSLYYKMTF